jgi:hypothetical protein
MWYNSLEFWLGIGVAFVIFILSYAFRIYLVKFFYWYQNWLSGLNERAYEFGQHLGNEYCGTKRNKMRKVPKR